MKLSTLGLLALAALTLVLSACSSSPEKHFDDGVEFQRQGRLEVAISEYDEAIRLNPQYAEAYSNRGIAYNILGQFQRAVQDFDEAIRINPQYANAYAGRAAAYTMLGKDEEADRDVDRALEFGFRRSLLDFIIEGLKSER